MSVPPSWCLRSWRDLEDAAAHHLHDGHVERTRAKIKDDELQLLVQLVEAVRESGRRRLVDEPDNLEARDGSRVLSCLPLLSLNRRAPE